MTCDQHGCCMNDLVFDLCGGPGGWDLAATRLGMRCVVGIEWDAAACLTRAAAGHRTIRADISRFPLHRLPPSIWGLIASPPCKTFSAAGSRAGAFALEILTRGIREAFGLQHTRAARRREMAACLRAAWWPSGKLTRAAQMAKIWPAVRDASLVIEPARYITATNPEWVALEQVPAVLPLWEAYAGCLRERGYSTWCGPLDAADYGVPQRRVRAILIASRARAVRRPEPTHSNPRKGMQLWGAQWVSMAEALGWGATERIAPTVTSGGTATGGAEPFGHRDRDALLAEQRAGRWLPRAGAPTSTRPTVAEAAVLQSFPLSYPWQGTKTKQHEQVGNAFPPLLAEHVLAMAAGIEREAVRAA